MDGPQKTRDLFKHGESAPAVVLKRWETGIVFNGNPQIGMLLEIRPASREAFHGELKTVVARPHLGVLNPGALLEVKFDPLDLTRIAIASLPGTDSVTRCE
jgi:hypothetical protein